MQRFAVAVHVLQQAVGGGAEDLAVDLGHGQLHVLLRPGELGKALGVLGDGGDEVALEALAVAVVEVEEALLALFLHLRGEELAEGSEVLDPIRLLAQGLLGHVRELGDAVRIHDLLAVRGLEQLVEVAVRLVDKFERALDQLLVGRAELDAQEAVLAQRAPLAAEDVVGGQTVLLRVRDDGLHRVSLHLRGFRSGVLLGHARLLRPADQRRTLCLVHALAVLLLVQGSAVRQRFDKEVLLILAKGLVLGQSLLVHDLHVELDKRLRVLDRIGGALHLVRAAAGDLARRPCAAIKALRDFFSSELRFFSATSVR